MSDSIVDNGFKQIHDDYRIIEEMARSNPILSAGIHQLIEHQYPKEFVYQKLIIALAEENELLKKQVLEKAQMSTQVTMTVNRECSTCKHNKDLRAFSLGRCGDCDDLFSNWEWEGGF